MWARAKRGKEPMAWTATGRGGASMHGRIMQSYDAKGRGKAHVEVWGKGGRAKVIHPALIT